MTTSVSSAGKAPRIVLGVGAGIAAYKSALLLRELQRGGAEVEVIPTPASEHFVGSSTWSGLTGRPVSSTVFSSGGGVEHVEAARETDLIVVAPATADLLAKIRAGLAGDLLTNTILAASCPVLLAPAMHTAMWEADATQDNIQVLRQRGFHFIGPASGALSSGDSGLGRMEEPEAIAARAWQIRRSPEQSSTGALAGINAIVTAGGTREALDPVRYLGNHSSGRQGCELARALAAEGAQVELIAANVDARLIPAGVQVTEVVSARDMEAAVMQRLDNADVVACVAAVADYRPANVSESKLKKGDHPGNLTLELVPNPDILASVVRAKPQLATLGFAAETGDKDASVQERGKEKAKRKKATFLAVNQVGNGKGFGDVDNRVSVLDKNGNEVESFAGTKAQVAQGLVQLLTEYLGARSR
ncbi:MAG: bifunctional phosphopantothenoylcysteine decarboxylase/phosphopantothenate--cysteine ligase CoaBC [Actinomycetaceae bacterium]|nr:bifunctional phosphopantothenoylcysteine decarboxylase/phosphopantothenate--cysteine ligase CoaBC [Actinomycetaceae bacterium]